MLLFGRADGNFGSPSGNGCIGPSGQKNQSNRKGTERVAQYGIKYLRNGTEQEIKSRAGRTKNRYV